MFLSCLYCASWLFLRDSVAGALGYCEAVMEHCMTGAWEFRIASSTAGHTVKRNMTSQFDLTPCNAGDNGQLVPG